MIGFLASMAGWQGKRPSAGTWRWLGLAVLAVALPVAAQAGDWPTYRHDNARSGVTAEAVKPPLVQCWVFQPRHAPAPAWGEPNPRPVGGPTKDRRTSGLVKRWRRTIPGRGARRRQRR